MNDPPDPTAHWHVDPDTGTLHISGTTDEPPNDWHIDVPPLETPAAMTCNQVTIYMEDLDPFREPARPTAVDQILRDAGCTWKPPRLYDSLPTLDITAPRTIAQKVLMSYDATAAERTLAEQIAEHRDRRTKYKAKFEHEDEIVTGLEAALQNMVDERKNTP